MFLSNRLDEVAGCMARGAERHVIRRVRLLAALALLPFGGVQAAETVLFNESAAHQCYLAALRGADAREIEVCNAALQHQSLKSADFAATLSNRGLLLARSGRYDEALRDHNRAIQTTPDLASLYINRSNTYTRAQRFDEALGDLDRAIDIASHPQQAAAPAPPAPAPSPAGEPGPTPGGPAVLMAPVPVPDTESQLAAAYYNRALLYQRRGELGAALADATRARDHAPDRQGYRQYVAELEQLRSSTSPGGAASGTGSPGASAPGPGTPPPTN